mmetsp:Transcript_37325/g.83048  ORF Transcript_37325/g.83048 Transcript_37325/m.83048 type:complete len:319 (-) Transcript_37325:47-1003(-)|eukprot:CAMPEP_0202920106 /NCGR_PEP_ID=MMETSP1392-20130828/76685_1 /ASSEMBLY_ACC=CAM_ASM_000868 /TAXON_ID=225041 /ORGANISM="Chlamydomonas chlamydogama, Strain SAG 11-48b" /LENGTH=318 /DNA_ID=CAMNT_0049613589 /DNA_START=81 /DNA_END=1037 /DNA_ORIENTATION=-
MEHVITIDSLDQEQDGDTWSIVMTPEFDKFGMEDAVGSSKVPVSFETHYPLYFIPLEVIMQMDALIPHEELIKQNKLVKTDGYTILKQGDSNYCTEHVFLRLANGKYLSNHSKKYFISHRWIREDGQTKPDNRAGAKLQALKDLLSGEFFANKEHTLIWFDYMCIPQAPENSQQQIAAIKSLPKFVCLCDVFAIVYASSTNQTEYHDRAFTNLERICAYLPKLAGGTSDSKMNSLFLSRMCEIHKEPWTSFNQLKWDPQIRLMNPLRGNVTVQADLASIEQVVNTVLAYLDEVEDRLKSRGGSDIHGYIGKLRSILQS